MSVDGAPDQRGELLVVEDFPPLEVSERPVGGARFRSGIGPELLRRVDRRPVVVRADLARREKERARQEQRWTLGLRINVLRQASRPRPHRPERPEDATAAFFDPNIFATRLSITT